MLGVSVECLQALQAINRELQAHAHAFLENTVASFAVLQTHTHPFNGPFSGTTQVSRYQKGKTNLDFTEVRDSEWQWHQLGHMQVCTLLQTDNHASTPPVSFLQAGCLSCSPTNTVKALKEALPCYRRVQLINTSTYRPLSAFRTQEITLLGDFGVSAACICHLTSCTSPSLIFQTTARNTALQLLA